MIKKKCLRKRKHKSDIQEKLCFRSEQIGRKVVCASRYTNRPLRCIKNKNDYDLLEFRHSVHLGSEEEDGDWGYHINFYSDQPIYDPLNNPEHIIVHDFKFKWDTEECRWSYEDEDHRASFYITIGIEQPMEFDNFCFESHYLIKIRK